MLDRIGASHIGDLFASIPEVHRLDRPLDLPPALDEGALMDHLTQLGDRNEGARALSFLGAGMYDHHIPPAVDQLLLRSELYTAYTPYQPEISQGTLQGIFEFQTLVCQLFDMDVANASLYDGASAAAEALMMARRIQKKTRCVVSAGLHPEYIDTVTTYLAGLDGGSPDLTIVPLDDSGRTDVDAVAVALAGGAAALLVGYPNFLGCTEDLAAMRTLCDEHDALLATATWEPYALGMLRPPGSFGADIAIGEGQALAVSPQFGGPGVGLFTCRQDHVRQMPGRLVGETVDQSGHRGYVLTLSTREQHIRRERATSNICTNHGLIALAMTIRAALLGRRGFEAIAKLCLSKTEYLKRRILETGRFGLPTTAPTFNEFVIRRLEGKAAPLLASLAAKGILAGVDMGRFDPAWERDILIAVTERHRRDDLDRLVAALAET